MSEGGWSGQKCSTCKGHGVDDENHRCNSCGGTGDEWKDSPIHSPLGASSAERWMNCPGSMALIQSLELPESDEADWRRDGVCAHEAAAHCLLNGLDAWEVVGMAFHEHKVDAEIAQAIQVYLDFVRPMMKNAYAQDKAPGHIEYHVYIEEHVKIPEHRLGYGTTDFGCVYEEDGDLVLDVDDYKHGQGIVVEVEDNPQILYYAYGLLAKLGDLPITKVNLRIIQPRGFHPSGPIRTWTTTPEYIRDWAAEELIPAMIRAEMDHDLAPGDHCRFCPARLVCPVLTGLFGAAMTADPKKVVELSDRAIGLNYQNIQGVKFYLKALEEEIFRRLNQGKEIAGVKLVHKKANRVWKDGARGRLESLYGPKIYTDPEMRTPAGMEAALGPGAAADVKEWAYTPESGLTVAPSSSKSPAVKVRSLKETFAAAVEELS